VFARHSISVVGYFEGPCLDVADPSGARQLGADLAGSHGIQKANQRMKQFITSKGGEE
jgi:hypothetical protein